MMVGQKTADEKLTFFTCCWQAEKTALLPQLKPIVENVCEALDSGIAVLSYCKLLLISVRKS